jgi:hypothetical protein
MKAAGLSVEMTKQPSGMLVCLFWKLVIGNLLVNCQLT